MEGRVLVVDDSFSAFHRAMSILRDAGLAPIPVSDSTSSQSPHEHIRHQGNKERSRRLRNHK